jgi:LmbE family N-acetylglucosaminyl deacetylase
MKTFLGKRILVLTAHPDDESYSASGTILKNRQMGRETFLITATLGEKGKAHLKEKISDTKLKAIRKKELMSAAKYLGIKKVFILGLGDGKLKGQQQLFFSKALKIAKKIQPELILSFGIDGISGHLDHVATGRVAALLSRKLGVKLVKFAISPKIVRSGSQWYLKRRRHSNYVKKITLPEGNIRIPIAKGVKFKALRYHASQIDGKNPFTYFPPDLVREMERAEYFII